MRNLQLLSLRNSGYSEWDNHQYKLDQEKLRRSLNASNYQHYQPIIIPPYRPRTTKHQPSSFQRYSWPSEHNPQGPNTHDNQALRTKHRLTSSTVTTSSFQNNMEISQPIYNYQLPTHSAHDAHETANSKNKKIGFYYKSRSRKNSREEEQRKNTVQCLLARKSNKEKSIRNLQDKVNRYFKVIDEVDRMASKISFKTTSPLLYPPNNDSFFTNQQQKQFILGRTSNKKQSQNISQTGQSVSHSTKQFQESPKVKAAFIAAKTIRQREKTESMIKEKKIKMKDFIVIKKLSKSKHSEIQLVVHRKTGFITSIKRYYNPQLNEGLMAQIIVELKIQLLLNHPNIVKAYSCFVDEQALCIIMEFMPDGHLQPKMEGKNPAEQLSDIVMGIAELHDRNIIHRDLKLENILMCEGVCKIGDFGVAAVGDRRATCCGTFDYMAPEIFNKSTYDFSLDIWCLGVLAFELLTGHLPFFSESRHQTCKRIKNFQGTLPFEEELAPCSRAFIARILKKHPEQRARIEQLLEDQYLKPYLKKSN